MLPRFGGSNMWGASDWTIHLGGLREHLLSLPGIIDFRNGKVRPVLCINGMLIKYKLRNRNGRMGGIVDKSSGHGRGDRDEGEALHRFLSETHDAYLRSAYDRL